jgi:hypothetical protein
MALTKIQPSGLDNTQDFSVLSPGVYNKANTAYSLATSALKVTSIGYPSNDTAADTGGGQTITLNGTGFAAGVTVVVGTTPAPTVTYVGDTLITFVTPALSTGTYVIYVINADGGTTLSVPGILYSPAPVWTTASGTILTVNKNTANANTTVVATGDAPVTYSLYSGTLPTGMTLSANTGVISGTSPDIATATTYSFAIRATDGQGQDTDRNFNIAVTVEPVVVVFAAPADGAGADQTWTVPTGVTQVQFKLWGAGGGGAGYNGDAAQSWPGRGGMTFSYNEFGGSGGYASGFRNVTPGETFTIRVGGGGYAVPATASGNDAGGFGGGANGKQGHGGGGGSFVFSGGTTFANVVAAAGGGGGGAYIAPGGAGGGTSGIGGYFGNPVYGGTGGTQSAGGSSPTVNGVRTYGSQLTGGAVAGDAGGGGGGGYYGGGGGTRDTSWGHCPGGGGSGYIGGLTGTTSLLQGGDSSTPGNAADSDRASGTVNASNRSAGQGGIANANNWAGGGRIVIRY